MSVRVFDGRPGYTTRQAAYDLRKFHGKGLLAKPGRTPLPGLSGRCPHHHRPAHPADQVINPILAGVRSPRRGRKPATWARIDRDYETLRLGMRDLFHNLGITAAAA